jgi:hypothetical protein
MGASGLGMGEKLNDLSILRTSGESRLRYDDKGVLVSYKGKI